METEIKRIIEILLDGLLGWTVIQLVHTSLNYIIHGRIRAHGIAQGSINHFVSPKGTFSQFHFSNIKIFLLRMLNTE